MMDKKRIFSWVLIMAVAILVSLIIIFPSTLAFSGRKAYRENHQSSSGAENTVQIFYNSYIQYEGNPLVDKTYQSSEYLTVDFIDFLDQFTSEGMRYDPILCAQDRPDSIHTEKAVISGDWATVPVTTSFADHSFEVELQQVNGDWKISNVICTTK